MMNVLSRHEPTAGERLAEMTEAIDDKTAGCALGMVSLAIGLTELAAPKQLDRFLGTGDGENAGVIRVLGVREIMHGVDLLMHDDPKPGVKARVMGDVLDGALLGLALAKSRRKGSVLAAFAMVMPVVLADVLFAKRLATERVQRKRDWLD